MKAFSKSVLPVSESIQDVWDKHKTIASINLWFKHKKSHWLQSDNYEFLLLAPYKNGYYYASQKFSIFTKTEHSRTEKGIADYGFPLQIKEINAIFKRFKRNNTLTFSWQRKSHHIKFYPVNAQGLLVFKHLLHWRNGTMTQTNIKEYVNKTCTPRGY